MTDYLRLQIAAGAQAVQIFDSWVGLLGADQYERFAGRHVRALISGVRDLGVPVIYFANGAPHLVEQAAATGADVLGLCWRTPLDQAARRVGSGVALQGNLDPHALFAQPDTIARLAADVVARGRAAAGHVMNLGHGILPDTPIAAVEALVAAVHEHGVALNSVGELP
jgi:uroporphyrinogen decarboxylase